MLAPAQKTADGPVCIPSENAEQFLKHFRARVEISFSITSSDGNKKSPLKHTLIPRNSPQHRNGKKALLTSVLAHVDLLFKNITETFAGIEKV